MDSHSPADTMSIRCGDCQGDAAIEISAEPSVLVRELQGFLAEHEACSMRVTLEVPSQRQPA